jgi:predicted nucleotidyltransferase
MDPLIQILKRLNDNGVDFVLIGGMAAIAHGSPLLTRDVDVCVLFSDENVVRMLDAFRGIRPRLRHRPDRMPLPDDPERLHGLKNPYLETDLGNIDLLGELPGVCSAEELKDQTVTMDVGGFTCRVLDLETLIKAKTVAGRPRDKLAVMHLEAIRKMRQQNPGLFEEPGR